jgi:predicted DNA binding CopG/RHH family protein
MKYYNLTKDEEQLLNDFKADEFVSIKKPSVVKHYRHSAQVTVSKTRNINIRLSEKDIQKIKARAVDKGIPYQTLVASILHQYSNR